MGIQSREDLDGARRVFSAYRIGWLGQRASDIVCCADLLSPRILVTCEGGADAELLAVKYGAALVAQEGIEPTRQQWTNASIEALADLSWPAVGIERTERVKDTVHLLAYCATPRWEVMAQRSHGALRLLAPAAALKRRLDDKVFFRSQLGALGLPTVPSEALPGTQLAFAGLAGRYGTPFILQSPFSSAGLGTYEIYTEEDLLVPLSAAPEQVWLVSRHMGPTSLNVNALVLPHTVIVAPPSVQLVGVPPLASSSMAYCGNDFGAAREHSLSVLMQIVRQTQVIGDWLRSLRFVGLFGVDFVVSHETVYQLELNPRFQGSTGLLGHWERDQGAIPLAALHALQWLGHGIEVTAAANSTSLTLADYAHIILHWSGTRPTRIVSSPRPGIYSLDRGHSRFVRPGLSVAECAGGEFLLTGLPRSGAAIQPGAAVARVLAREQLAEADGRRLTPRGHAIIAALHSALMAQSAAAGSPRPHPSEA